MRVLLQRGSRRLGTATIRGLLLIPVAALGCLLATQGAAGQQTGTVTGVVSDVATGQTLESASVKLDDAPRGVLTNTDGRYVVLNVPAGTHQLTFQILGYDDLTLQVEVVAGETLERNAEMTSGALELQGLVVTGMARATPKVKLAITVEKIDVANIPVPAISAESFLTGKAPGIKVVRGGGQPGSSGDIMLRGATSISGGQAPLVIVDGIITNDSFDDLATLDIESIEVVKGAAGASLYGSRAANGVIQIRTKRGSGFAGRDYSRLVMRSEMGQDRLQGSIQLSQNHPWLTDASGNLIDVNGNVIPDITDPDMENPGLNGANVFTSFQDGLWPSSLETFDHVARIYQPGTFLNNYGAIEGRNGDTNYRTSFEWQTEGGVLPQYNDGFDRRGFRTNLDHEVPPEPQRLPEHRLYAEKAGEPGEFAVLRPDLHGTVRGPAQAGSLHHRPAALPRERLPVREPGSALQPGQPALPLRADRQPEQSARREGLRQRHLDAFLLDGRGGPLRS